MTEPGPVEPLAVQDGSVSLSQPERQKRRLVSGENGNPCAVPVHPMSRSVPALPTVKSSSSGPSGLPGQAARGVVVVVVDDVIVVVVVTVVVVVGGGAVVVLVGGGAVVVVVAGREVELVVG